jgi:hypothetical protein
VAAVAVVVWGPALIARAYTSGPGAASVSLIRPDRGWEFLANAAWTSRNADLPTAAAARRRAREIWAGPPAIAERVQLVYLDGDFDAPVPDGATAAADGHGRVSPASRLGWVVSGPVRGGREQMIGLLDYGSGRVVWDIRPIAERSAA